MNDQIARTLSPAAAAGRRWDLLIVGAGPAGAVAAQQAALLGHAVLLVDRASFPRAKVCGCCLNGAALGILSRIGLGHLPAGNGAVPLSGFQLATGGGSATVPLDEGVSLSRDCLDAELIRAAIEAGAEFLDGTDALVARLQGAARDVCLTTDKRVRQTGAAVVLIAGGLGCRVFREQPDNKRRSAPRSRVGAGAVIEAPASDYPPGIIHMACHRDGYAGLVRLEDGRLDIAAALDPRALKRGGGIAALIVNILQTTRMPIPAGLDDAAWHGTARLTQGRAEVAGERYFIVGDAAGYIEPFTGEGIAWAMATGHAVVPHLNDFLGGRETAAAAAWRQHRNAMLGRRMRRCRIVSRLLRYPTLVSAAVHVLSRAPQVARPFVNALNQPFRCG